MVVVIEEAGEVCVVTDRPGRQPCSYSSCRTGRQGSSAGGQLLPPPSRLDHHSTPALALLTAWF